MDGGYFHVGVQTGLRLSAHSACLLVKLPQFLAEGTASPLNPGPRSSAENEFATVSLGPSVNNEVPTLAIWEHSGLVAWGPPRPLFRLLCLRYPDFALVLLPVRGRALVECAALRATWPSETTTLPSATMRIEQ